MELRGEMGVGVFFQSLRIVLSACLISVICIPFQTAYANNEISLSQGESSVFKSYEGSNLSIDSNNGEEDNQGQRLSYSEDLGNVSGPLDGSSSGDWSEQPIDPPAAEAEDDDSLGKTDENVPESLQKPDQDGSERDNPPDDIDSTLSDKPSSDSSENTELQAERNVSTDAPISDGLYVIACSLDPSQVLDVANASADNGGILKIWKRNDQKNQAFKFEAQLDGSYIIRAVHSSKVLAVSGIGASRGAAVIQWTDNNTANMRWNVKKVEGGYCLVSADTGMYLDFASNACVSGTDVVAWPENNAAKQIFSLVVYEEPLESDDLQVRTVPNGVYSLNSKQDIRQSLTVGEASVSDGASIRSQTNVSNLSQKFFVTFQSIKDDRGWYVIRALCSGKVLAVAGLNAQNGANVLQWSDNGTRNMRWLIQGNEAQGYNLLSADSELALDFACDQVFSGANSVVWEQTGSTKQRFVLEKTEPLSSGYYSIAPTASSNLLMNINDNSLTAGVNAILWPSTGSLAQKYRVTSNEDGTYQFKVCQSGKVLDVSSEGMVVQVDPSPSLSQRWTITPDLYGGFQVSAFRTDGVMVCFWTGGDPAKGISVWAQEYPPRNKNQSFIFKEVNIVEDGLYTIQTAVDSNISLSLASGSLASGQGTRLNASGASIRQKFFVSNSGGGRVQILSEISDKALCVAYGSSRGASVVQWDNNATDNMRWDIVPTYQGSVYVQNVASGMNLDFSADSPVLGAAGVVWDPHGGEKQMFIFSQTSLPSFKVYVDAGHGWNSSNYGEYDSGAVSLYKENDLTNELASKVVDRCEELGIAATTNAYATSKTGVAYWQRQAEARSLECTTFISIHFNSGGGSGVESYIHTYNAARGSSTLQSIMHQYLVSGTGLRSRLQGKMELAVCGGKLPSVLLEVGFVDSPYDMGIYQSKKNGIADFLVAGIKEVSKNPICNAYN